MKYYTDLHIHSRFSRGTSNTLDVDSLARAAKIKGIGILGTGDFSHPEWLEELKTKLKERDGVYEYDGVFFIPTTEISLIYKKDGKQRRIHHLILAPNFEVVDKINVFLGSRGRLDYDGRPIFGMSSEELMEGLLSISKDITVIPAHCLLPGSKILSESNIVSIEDIKKGDYVYTHKGDVRKVTETHKRHYKGSVIGIIPWYFSMGLTTTPEHPYFAISASRCKWKGGICKPTPIHRAKCKHRAFETYKPQWIQAKNLTVGDILVFPRFVSETRDTNTLAIRDFTSRNGLPQTIETDIDFFRLLGYYLSEGYSNGRDAIGFTFNGKEKEYIEDVKQIVLKIFGITPKHGKTPGDIMVYSWGLRELFEKLCYTTNENVHRAWTKSLPQWTLKLPLAKQAEILRGWWRGDKGYTCSRLLAHQMRVICLRLGVIPSLSVSTTVTDHFKRGNHEFQGRIIKAGHDLYSLGRPAFFEDNFGLLKDSAFASGWRKSSVRHGWIDEQFAYLPIRSITTSKYNGSVYNLEVDEDQSYLTESAAVHNCWTPWYAMFGSKSGFDSVEECFGEFSKHIFALETGLSSDPAMNWRISKLDKYALVSFSDAHSAAKLGRECCLFNIKRPSYSEVISAIRDRDPKRFLMTVEFYPEEGKYHWDGHRSCSVAQSPAETMKKGDKCNVCGHPLTIGVAYRVEQLADRPIGFRPENAVPFKSLIPLAELISLSTGKGVATNTVQKVFDTLIARFENEFSILLGASIEDLTNATNEKLAGIIIRNRNGKIRIQPGYDGVYGKPLLTETPSNLTDFIK